MERRWLAFGIVALAVAGGPPAGAEDAFRCELREARGVPEPDAGTAARVVCDHLRRASGAGASSASPWGPSEGRSSSP